MVTVPHYWGRRSLSFRRGLAFWRGTQRPCLIFVGDMTSHSVPRQGSREQYQEHVTLHSDSRRGRGRPGRRKTSAREFVSNKSKNFLSSKASRSQYMACQPAASVSRLGESSGRLQPPRKTVITGSVCASRALIRGALPIFPALASRALRALTSEHVGQAQGKSGRHVRSGCSAVLQHEQIPDALRRAVAGIVKITISSVVGKVFCHCTLIPYLR
jgi:hypothetical protein